MDGSEVALIITAIGSAICVVMTTIVTLKLTWMERMAALGRLEAAEGRVQSKVNGEKLSKIEHHINSMQDKLVETTRSDAFQKGEASAKLSDT
jgi:hypothetical protein